MGVRAKTAVVTKSKEEIRGHNAIQQSFHGSEIEDYGEVSEGWSDTPILYLGQHVGGRGDRPP